MGKAGTRSVRTCPEMAAHATLQEIITATMAPHCSLQKRILCVHGARARCLGKQSVLADGLLFNVLGSGSNARIHASQPSSGLPV
jgi:hypothetical protein